MSQRSLLYKLQYISFSKKLFVFFRLVLFLLRLFGVVVLFHSFDALHNANDPQNRTRRNLKQIKVQKKTEILNQNKRYLRFINSLLMFVICSAKFHAFSKINESLKIEKKTCTKRANWWTTEHAYQYGYERSVCAFKIKSQKANKTNRKIRFLKPKRKRTEFC